MSKTDAEHTLSDESVADRRQAEYGSIDISDVDTVISKGALDPVYEKKAVLLNRAVSGTRSIEMRELVRAHRMRSIAWKENY